MQEKTTIPLEVENLSKGAVEQVSPDKDLLLRSLVTLKKKDGGKRPMINFKELNQFIPFLHFKMDNLNEYMCKKNEYMWKLDLKKAYLAHFLTTTERQWCFDAKEHCTSFYACALALQQPHMFP